MTDDGHFLSRVAVKDRRDDRAFNLDLHVTDAMVLALTGKYPLYVTEETFRKKEAEDQKRSGNEDATGRIFGNIDWTKVPKM